MIPKKPLPYSDEFSSPEEYVQSLLRFATTTEIFRTLCGGVHILDFFTSEPGIFQVTIPPEWQAFLLSYDTNALLDLLMRDDLDALPEAAQKNTPPASLIEYIRDIRRLSLGRSFTPRNEKLPKLARTVAVGMKPKKIHEVTNFADYVDRISDDIATICGQDITHYVDFGSGQNYLGRTLALPPYNRNVVAVEEREHNIAGAKELDLHSGLATKEKVMRNKKLWNQFLDSKTPSEQLGLKAQKRIAKGQEISSEVVADLRPDTELQRQYIRELGKGSVSYVVGRLESGDLSDIITKIEQEVMPEETDKELRLMAVSIHSCGNLSHYGIRSLVMNPAIRAVAIVGCCYNLLTEKLGPPTHKIPFARPSLQAVNGRAMRESSKFDPQGFPLSERLSSYDEHGIGLNITARMMACQAPQNWTESESAEFFKRHFFRAVLQKVFLDRGVVSRFRLHEAESNDDEAESPFNMGTNPVIIGSLRKRCYASFGDYIRGAVTKLTTDEEYSKYSSVIKDKMTGMPDEDISRYEEQYLPRKKEVAAIWSLMAFSACVVESLIVTDRWLFLKEHADVVQDCWVETVFDFKESPRNLVVVGIKK